MSNFFGKKFKNIPRFVRKPKPKDYRQAAPPSIKIGYPTLVALGPGANEDSDLWAHESRRSLQEVTKNMPSVSTVEAVGDPVPSVAVVGEELGASDDVDAALDGEDPEPAGGPAQKPLRRFRGKVKKRKGKKGRKASRKRSSYDARACGKPAVAAEMPCAKPLDAGANPVDAGANPGDADTKLVDAGAKPLDAGAKPGSAKDPDGPVHKSPSEVGEMVGPSTRNSVVQMEPLSTVPLSGAEACMVPSRPAPDPVAVFVSVEQSTSAQGELRINSVTSITCSVSDFEASSAEKAVGQRKPRLKSVGDLESILVCYFEPDERKSFMGGDDRDFDMTTLGMRCFDVFRTLENRGDPAGLVEVPAALVEVPAALVEVPAALVEVPAGRPVLACAEPEPRPKATSTRASQSLQVEVCGRVVPVKASLASVPEALPHGSIKCIGARQQRESHELKSIVSRWHTRESLLNLCGVSIESPLFGSRRASICLDIADFGRRPVVYVDHAPVAPKACPPQMCLPQPAGPRDLHPFQLATPEMWDSPIPSSPEVSDCETPATPHSPDYLIPETPELSSPGATGAGTEHDAKALNEALEERDAVTDKVDADKESVDNSAVDKESVKIAVDADKESADKNTVDADKESADKNTVDADKESADKNTVDADKESVDKVAVDAKDKESVDADKESVDTKNAPAATPAKTTFIQNNVCTKMGQSWWDCDSENDREANAPHEETSDEESQGPEGEPELAPDGEPDGDSGSDSDSDDSVPSNASPGRAKSIFRQGNTKAAAGDLFSECFDSVADPSAGTCAEDTCLYKLVFPDEKEVPRMFQSRGFMAELNQFVEKSNIEASKAAEPKAREPRKPRARAGADARPVLVPVPAPVPVPEDDGKTSMVDVKNAPRSEDEFGQDYIESCQQIFVNGNSFWMQTELLVLQMEDAVASPLKEKKKAIKFEEDIDANCPQLRLACDDSDDESDSDWDHADISKWDLRPRDAKPAAVRIRGCLKAPTKEVRLRHGSHSEKVGFKILANLMENVDNMAKKLGATCKGRGARATVLATLKEFELILLNVKHFEVDVNYESIIRYIKRMLRLRRKLGEILSLTCGLQTEYVLVAEALQDGPDPASASDRASDPAPFDRAYWMLRLRRCVQSIRDSRKQLRAVKAEIHDILAGFSEKTIALFKQSRKILKMRDDLLAQYQHFILANHVSAADMESSLESLRAFKEFLALYSTICTDGFKRLLWDDINVLDKSRMIFENMNTHFGASIKRQQLTLRGLQRPNELDPADHRSKYKFRREISLLKKERRARHRLVRLAC